MNILMLAQFYAPIIGGEERHVQDLSVELVKRGHKVAVATLQSPGTPEFEIDQGVRIYRIKSTTQRASWLYKQPERSHHPPFPDPEVTRALRQIIKLENPQIVHAHNWMLYSFLPLKGWSGLPSVWARPCPSASRDGRTWRVRPHPWTVRGWHWPVRGGKPDSGSAWTALADDHATPGGAA